MCPGRASGSGAPARTTLDGGPGPAGPGRVTPAGPGAWRDTTRVRVLFRTLKRVSATGVHNIRHRWFTKNESCHASMPCLDAMPTCKRPALAFAASPSRRTHCPTDLRLKSQPSVATVVAAHETHRARKRKHEARCIRANTILQHLQPLNERHPRVRRMVRVDS